MKQTNLLSQKPSRSIAVIMIFAILAATTGSAQSRHLASEAIRSRVLNLGVGQWVRVREHSGLNLNGQITSIGPRLFQIQQHDATAPADVYYADVARIKCVHGPSEQGDFPPGAWAGLAIFGAIFLTWAICKQTSCTKSASQASW